MAILKKKKKSTETKPTFNKTEYENYQLELYRLKQQKSLIENKIILFQLNSWQIKNNMI